MQIKPDEAIAFDVAAVVSLGAIEDQYSDDAYGEDDEWAERQPDLGENA
ncbi:hypothetical protein SAMN05216559_1304 [Halomicrobium zhouii]|uniref:Uncharacterized protein n=1 Tax=Halomicrobium zhouii TaxID=767519 RepID=A0A1I6KRD1_9EURY|nr:hypothetical protein [Halomicrobium zhouii]SFR93470.1 hypothetical protein SAMN05216559_1304 [Halomicrobium zhouii]